MGPGTLCCSDCSACTWTNISWSNEIQRHSKGLKISAYLCSWSKLWARRYKQNKTKQKTPNPTASCEEPGAKAGCWKQKPRDWACPLHTTPPKGWADHLSYPSDPAPAPVPTLTLNKEPASPTSGSQQARETFACFHSLLMQQGPQ